jgi:hypothetical protein
VGRERLEGSRVPFFVRSTAASEREQGLGRPVVFAIIEVFAEVGARVTEEEELGRGRAKADVEGAVSLMLNMWRHDAGRTYEASLSLSLRAQTSPSGELLPLMSMLFCCISWR